MAWTPTIPTAIQFISASQPLIQGNFQELDTWSRVDHSPIASAVGLNGYHYKTTFPPQAVAPAFPATYLGLFSQLSAISGINELFINYANGVNRPITQAAYNQFAFAVHADNYFYTPSGNLIKYNFISYNAAPGVGQFTDTAGPGNGNFTYTYTVAANRPVFASSPYVYAVVVANQAATQGLSTTLVTSTNLAFTFQVRLANPNFGPWIPPVNTGILFVSIGN